MGVWAEIFLAALESAAFCETDRERLLDTMLGFLPSESRVKRHHGRPPVVES